MFRFIYRQRRRLMFSSFFCTLGLMLLVGADDGGFSIFKDVLWVYVATIAITTLIVAFCILAVVALFIVVLPGWRTMVEVMSIVLFTQMIVAVAAPWIIDIPYIGSFTPFIITMMIFSMTYGEFSDRFRMNVDHPETRKFYSPKAAEDLWSELVPEADTLSDHWDTLLCDLEPDDEDPDSYQAKYTHGGSLYELQTMTYLEKNAPYSAKYHHLGDVNPKNRSLVEGTYEIHIAPKVGKDGCTVTLTSRHNAVLLRTALLRWLDDDLGDRTAHLRAKHKGRRDWSMTGRYRRKVGEFA